MSELLSKLILFCLFDFLNKQTKNAKTKGKEVFFVKRKIYIATKCESEFEYFENN